MELHQVEEVAATSINSKLRKVGESPTQPFIYKIHGRYLHGSNDYVYEPAIVAIGPYHRDKHRLKMVEELKPRYLKSLLLRKNETVERYISAAAEMGQAARHCYAEPINLSAPEFIEMLVLDACFIIELLQKLNAKASCDHDPIFQMKWILNSLMQDLMLFENQIPFFVLCKMFDLIHEPNQHQQLIKLVCFSYRKGNLYHSNWNNRSPKVVKHLLHFLHTVSRPSSNLFINLNRWSHPRELPVIPSATELKDANVRFLKKESNTVYEVEFKNETLTMPALIIEDGTERFFRNFIVYEQYFCDNQPTYVTDYTMILDCLVNTSRDVEILSRCGVIKNLLGDNQQAADVINRLGCSVSMSGSDFIYYDMFTRINAHYKKRWNRARAALNRHYFNTPWAYISFSAAVLLLLLTLAQTVFSAIQL